jgi:hypothetical protein
MPVKCRPPDILDRPIHGNCPELLKRPARALRQDWLDWPQEDDAMRRWLNNLLDSEPGFVEAVVVTLLCLIFVLWVRGGG